MIACSALALLIAGGGSELGADTYPRQPGIDARHYAVRLTLLTSDSNEIQAEATVTLRIVAPGTREAILDLTSLEQSLPNTPVVHANLDEAATSPNNRLVYEKGAWTLHMLRDLIGTEPFWRGIRLYYQRHANGVASTADLRRAMEEVSGQDLGWFFAQWLTRSGVPQVSGSWRYDSAAKQIVMTVRQTQAGDPYRFALGVGVSAASGAAPAIRQVQVTGRESTFSIPADAEPASVVLDPGVWLLAELGSFQKAVAR